MPPSSRFVFSCSCAPTLQQIRSPHLVYLCLYKVIPNPGVINQFGGISFDQRHNITSDLAMNEPSHYSALPYLSGYRSESQNGEATHIGLGAIIFSPNIIEIVVSRQHLTDQKIMWVRFTVLVFPVF